MDQNVISFTPAGVVVIATLLGSLAGALGFVFKLLMANITSERDNYRSMLAEAINTLEVRNNADRKAQGKPPRAKVAAVVAEHNSPVTTAQEGTAELATFRARLVTVQRDWGMEPRTAADHPTYE